MVQDSCHLTLIGALSPIRPHYAPNIKEANFEDLSFLLNQEAVLTCHRIVLTPAVREKRDFWCLLTFLCEALTIQHPAQKDVPIIMNQYSIPAHGWHTGSFNFCVSFIPCIQILYQRYS